MKVLVLNGSPKGERSNTLRLTRAFVEGIQSEQSCEVAEIKVSEKHIAPCMGCFSCWKRTPGKCCLRDDMDGVLPEIVAADVVIWSFPLYFYSMPSGIKAVMDRQLPMFLPFMAESESGGHPARYDMSGKRYAVISTCGFYTAKGNYDAVRAQFDRELGKGGYAEVFCGQGELFGIKELNGRTGEYLDKVRRAGSEFAWAGKISEGTQSALDEMLFQRAVFEKMADASWGQNASGEKTPETLTFTRQMAALYRPQTWKGQDRVVEMHYTDTGDTWQLVLEKTGCRVISENFLKYTTRIDTPYSLWKQIAAGEVRGDEAMMAHKYRVEGDFSLMMQWGEIFSGAGAQEEQKPQEKRGRPTSMMLLLLPWIVAWIGLPINALWGSVAGLAVCAAVPFFGKKYKITRWDGVSAVLVAGICACVLLGAPMVVLLPLSYLAMGLMWLVTAFMKVPITAEYSMNDYGGTEVLHNPVFIKTNRILTVCWGVLYVVTPVWTYFLMQSRFASMTGAINSCAPFLLGGFTKWFSGWYPAHIAGGNIRQADSSRIFRKGRDNDEADNRGKPCL